MLQSILDGAAEGPFEFELVFFDDGPWARELAAAGFAVTVLPVGRLRQLHRFAGAVRRLAAIMRARRPALILNWSAKTQLYGSSRGAARRDVLARPVVAAVDPRRQRDRPPGDGASRARDPLLLARRQPAPSGGCGRCARRSRSRPGRRSRPPTGEPAAIALPAGVPVVGIVGRLQQWKGQDRLLRAQALLRARGRELHCLIVGGDAYELSPEYAASLPRLVAELGLEGHVTMTGQVPDAGPYIERMDVLVNASDPEPFGIVLLEGMARGVAVLAVDSGGPSEFIANMETGVLAPTRRARGRSPTRSRRSSTRPSCARAWPRPDARASCATTPTPRCAGACSPACSPSSPRPPRRSRLERAGPHRARRRPGGRIERRAAPATCR